MKGAIPYVFIWPYALAFWTLYLWAFLPEIALTRRAKRASKDNARPQDRGSMSVINQGGGIGVLIAFWLAFTPRFRVPDTTRFMLFWVGLLLLVGGSLLRRHCKRVLGEYFTGNVVVRPDHVVIERGAYRLVRHPSYTGGIVMYTAIGLALGSWPSTLVMFLSAVAVYVYRVRVEERALVSTIGGPYVEFMKTRKRFIPYLI